MKCAATPRFTIAERTPETHSDATSGKRFSRAGGTEYAVPTTSAAATAASSSAPWVSASASGRTAAAPTIHHARSSDRSPAAIGSPGLLTRSMSTSVIWLMPTM